MVHNGRDSCGTIAFATHRSRTNVAGHHLTPYTCAGWDEYNLVLLSNSLSYKQNGQPFWVEMLKKLVVFKGVKNPQPAS